MAGSDNSYTSNDSSESSSLPMHLGRSRSRSESRSRQRGSRGGGRYYQNRKQKPRQKRNVIKFPLDEPFIEFEKFAEQYAEEIKPERMKKVYQAYEKQWENNQKEIFFEQHKNEQWIQDKYNPILRRRLLEQRITEAKENFHNFTKNYNLSFYNSINLTVTEQQLSSSIIDSSDVIQLTNDSQDVPYKDFPVKEFFDLTKSPFFASDVNAHCLFIKSIPNHISRWDIFEIFCQLPGFANLTVSEAQKVQNYQRLGWVGFASEETANQALKNMESGVMIKGSLIVLSKQQDKKKTVRILRGMEPNRFYKDYQTTRELIHALDKEKGITGNPLTEGPTKDRDDPNILRQLDLQTLYLRKVHSYCYWSGGEFVDERYLNQKAGSVCLRLESKSGKKSGNLKWQDIIQQLAKKRMEDPGYEPKASILQQAIQRYEYQLQENNHVKSQDVFPCARCNKQFSGPDFLRKHISNKHTQEYNAEIKEIEIKIVNETMMKMFQKEKKSKSILQKSIFLSQSLDSDQVKEITIPLNFAPRFQQRLYKDLDNILQEKQETAHIIIAPKESKINYNDI